MLFFNFLGITFRPATPYHPSSNGKVERYRRKLKASLRTSAGTSPWAEMLSLVLLGIVTACKNDIGRTPVEVVYDTVLRIPGESLTGSESTTVLDLSDYASCLQTTLETIKRRPPRLWSRTNAFICFYLLQCTFVGNDVVRNLLQPSYDGSYFMVQRIPKHLTCNIKGRHGIVSVDRVKPAYLVNLLFSEAFHPHASCAPPPVVRSRGVSLGDPVASFYFFKHSSFLAFH